MNVYSLASDANNYQNLVLVHPEEHWDVAYRFDGTPIGANWRPLRVQVLKDDEQNKDLPSSDFPAFLAPVFSRRAIQILEPVLRARGELLPLDCEEGEYFLFNATSVVDALDEEHSNFVRFSNGKIMDIQRFAFHESILKGLDMFKIPQLPLRYIFVTEGFAERVREAGLEGFILKKVWG